MSNIIDFPSKLSEIPKKAVTLTGTQWLAVMLKLAGRTLGATGQAELDEAEASMLKQLGEES